MARLLVKEIAERQGLNQSRLTIKAGVTYQLVHRWWKGNPDSIKLSELSKVAKALGVKPGDLIAEDEMEQEVSPAA